MRIVAKLTPEQISKAKVDSIKLEEAKYTAESDDFVLSDKGVQMNNAIMILELKIRIIEGAGQFDLTDELIKLLKGQS